MMRTKSLVVVALLAMGCGGSLSVGGKPKALDAQDKTGRKTATGHEVSKAAAQGFDRALDAFAAHDKKQDWTEASCSEVAKSFLDANAEQKSAANTQLPEALYNAGLAYQRCGKDGEAKAQFEAAAQIDAKMHRARAQLALYDYQRTGDQGQAIRQLDQIIRDAKFQNAEALVALAALQMDRGSDEAGEDCKNDLECAQRNLQRALAIDDSYMPAFNQLAIYYLEQAKSKAGMKRKGRGGKRALVVSGTKGVDVNEQQLDLAALVASQAQRKNANYAPLHNTSGLILVELKNYNGAVKAFGRARALDPKFFEAHMNYAAVNLSFRGFAEAEKAYRDALKLRPKEYEAHLGLALAMRGQIDNNNHDKNVAEAQKHLDEAKKVDPQRPETYYNEAILTQEYRAKRGANAVPMLEKASQQYQDFIAKAGGDAQFAPAVKRSKERVQDINDMVKFIKEGEQAAKDDAARQAAEKKAAAEKAKAPAAPPAKKK